MAKARVTINDVAREAGVALGTVSNVLNHPDKVRPETLAIVNEAIAKLGYSPNQSARMLAGGHNPSFGLVLPSFEHGISLQIANGANAEARKHGYGLLIANADNNEVQSGKYAAYFAGIQMAGIMIKPLQTHEWEPSFITRAIPTVWMDCQSSETGYFVSADSEAQGRLIAEHAVECDAQHIVVLGENSLEKLKRRLRGIQLVLERNPHIKLEIINEGAWNLPHDGYSIGYGLSKRSADHRPDFIIALSDVLATGAIAGIQAAGGRVPEDIRVAGCDGNPLAWNGNIPLTTIAPPGYEIGRKGVRYLIRQVEEKRRVGNALPTENHQELVRPFLMSRSSTGTSSTTDFADPDIDISGYL